MIIMMVKWAYIGTKLVKEIDFVSGVKHITFKPNREKFIMPSAKVMLSLDILKAIWCYQYRKTED